MAFRTLVVVMDHTILGGVEISILELMRVVRSWGTPVHLITQNRAALFPEFEKIATSILVTKLPYPRKLKTWMCLPKFLWQCHKFFKTIPEPITILSSDVFTLWAALWLQKKHRSVYGFWQGEFNPQTSKDIRKWVQYGAKRAKGLLANECLAITMNCSGLLKPTEVNAVNIPIAVEFWDPSKHLTSSLKHTLGWSKTKKIALCIGRITPQKGQYALVENFAKQPKLMDQWQLILAGPIESNAYKTQFTNLLATISPDNIQYIGPRTDIAELMANADCVLYPGRHHEGFCLVVAEALLMLKPVIAYGGGAIAYLLGPNYPGLIPYNDQQAFYNCWQKIDLQDLRWNKAAHRNKILRLADRNNFEFSLKKAFKWD